MSKKKLQIDSSDRISRYADEVCKGLVIAGPDVRAACKRHLTDLVEGPKRGLVWDLDAAKHAIAYFEEVLCLNGGEFEGLPFDLQGWQAFIVGSLYGWKTADGYRRFRVAYVETAKGSGKSPLAAGIGLYGLTADGESRAEVYAAATKKEQAQILFRDAIAMKEQSPQLAARLITSGSKGKEHNLAYHKTSSFFRPIAADEGQSGPRPHVALIDEVHEHKTPHVIEMMRAGTKSRRQALIFMITNSGNDKRSVCWDYHAYGSKVCAGTLTDDSFFAFICSLDIGDDPFNDETCWAKANPSLEAGIPGIKYLREQVTQARGMPSKEALVRRLNFCQWTEANAPWIAADVWFDCQADDGLTEQDFYGRSGVAAFDISSTTDLTAFVIALDPTDDDPYTRLLPYFWLPGDGLQQKADRDRVSYLVWRDEGHLFALPGRSVDKVAVLHKITELSSFFEIREVACDRWRLEDYLQLAEREGLSLPPISGFGQGFESMAPAVDEFETRLLNQRIRHDGNPVLTWNAANAVLSTDPAGNRKLTKAKAIGRIDGMVAAVMAVGLTLGAQSEEDNLDDALADPIFG
ncbi:MAG: terminase large subunit [Oxalicibacterium faecigallinarum]|uniref:terminase large subunit n=1 Tax=Oxalicibacterium faecigallinarum TaxID=573741 RepID=UPI002807808A|nr:terminase TerL endonuclease subunit [Oxalicibacterium faecigallinarum]MDQ7970745.1 terminase large subunit [Oxalicibacterium faecigallinarum]